MLHINTQQVDPDSWTYQVTKGDDVLWSGTLNGCVLTIRHCEGTSGRDAAMATVEGYRASTRFGHAMWLIANWSQISFQCTEPLDLAWYIRDIGLEQHFHKQDPRNFVERVVAPIPIPPEALKALTKKNPYFEDLKKRASLRPILTDEDGTILTDRGRTLYD